MGQMPGNTEFDNSPIQRFAKVDSTGAAVGTTANPDKVSMSDGIAGEDMSADVLKVENRFRYGVESSADVLVQTGLTFLHRFIYSCTGAAVVIIRDGTTSAGTIVKTLDIPVGVGSLELNLELSAGLFIDYVSGTLTFNEAYR